MPRKLLKKKKANWTLPMCIAHAQFCHFTIKLTSSGFLSILERQILCELAQKISGPTRKITLPLPYISNNTLSHFPSFFFFFCSFHPSYFTSYQTHPKIAFIIVSFSYASMCHLMSNHCTLHCDGSSLFSKVTKV